MKLNDNIISNVVFHFKKLEEESIYKYKKCYSNIVLKDILKDCMIVLFARKILNDFDDLLVCLLTTWLLNSGFLCHHVYSFAVEL